MEGEGRCWASFFPSQASFSILLDASIQTVHASPGVIWPLCPAVAAIEVRDDSGASGGGQGATKLVPVVALLTANLIS